MHLSNNTLLQGGKYRIVRFLSSGGFGNTYEGVHTMMDTRVAIKEFFPKMFCNRDENTSHVTVATQGNRELVEKLRKKFNEEAKAIYKMKHDNIVRVQDIFEENGTAYYVMEYIDGKSLHDIVNERGALPEAEAVGYIRQVADALKYVHSLNRLHLDIKPGNIMVDKNGKAILIDFGASKHYDMESGENTSTLMGLNTKGYAPPEQSTQSFTSFSPATDIYALGATLYKLLTGVTPPDANLLLVEEEELKPMPSNITATTCNAVMSAMALRRKDRPQSIDEFEKKLSCKNDSPKEKVRFVHEKKTESTSVEDERTIVENDDPDVYELCLLTGKSKAVCEKALKQTYGNKHVAIFRIQTDILYEKVGSTKLGIDWDTCKRYIENADGSLEKAEKRIKALIAERENAIESLFAYYGNENDPYGLDMETCRKEYANANYDKKVAENRLFAKKRLLTTERPSTNSEGNFITRYLSEKWTMLTDNVFSVIFYLVLYIISFTLGMTTEGFVAAIALSFFFTGGIAFILWNITSWLFDEDLGFAKVSLFVYGFLTISSLIILAACAFCL